MPRAGWLALGAIGAALIGGQLNGPAVALLCAGAAVALAAAARAVGRSGVGWLFLAAALILVRVAVGGAFMSAVPRAAPGTADANIERTVLVVTVGNPAGGQQRAVIELQPPDEPARVYAWLPRYPPIIPGDVVRVSGRLESAPIEPGFGEFLARSGVGWTLRSRELERLDAAGASVAGLERVRRDAGELLARSLPQPQAGLAGAIVIGLRDLVDRDVADDFRVAGMSHIVAISGWHVALVAAMLGALLRGLGRRPRSLLLVVAICAYAVLAGGAPSVIRAAVMATVVLLARESGRRGHASAALGLAVTGILLVEPATVDEVGFQLSVAATAGLLVWSTQLGDWLKRRAPRAMPGWLIETLAVSLAAQAATLPLVLLHFGRLSLVAPLSNLLAAPLVAPAMIAAGLALVAGGVAALGLPAVLLAPITLAGALALGALIGVAQVAASLPFASVELSPPLDLAVAGLAAVVVGLLLHRRRTATTAMPAAPAGIGEIHPPAVGARSPRAALAAVGLIGCLLAVLLTTARPDARLHMTVLDVGQGDAILLTGPRGARMLVDTGPDPDRLLALLDERLPAWDRRLDLVAITHPHEDHVAGLALLLDRYRIGGVVEPGMIGPGPGDAAFRQRMAQLGRQSRVVAAGDRLTLDGIQIDIHWPRRGTVPLRAGGSGKEINNVSLVLDLRFGERRLLLTGDVEEEIDPQLMAAGLAATSDRRLDVLKVAHHGSGTATTDAFVEQLRPRVAVVSAGLGNPYGHPSPKTVARLRDVGAQLFRTDLNGTVEITTDGRDLTASAGGGRPAPSRPASRLPPGLGFCPIGPTAGSRRRPYNRRQCPSPRARRLRRFCSTSIHPRASCATQGLSPRSPPSWRGGLPSAARTWTWRSSRSPPCCTTLTRCCRASIRFASRWPTAMPAPPGWPSAGTTSWVRLSPLTPPRA